MVIIRIHEKKIKNELKTKEWKEIDLDVVDLRGTEC